MPTPCYISIQGKTQGMKMGVCTTPWFSVSRPRRARWLAPWVESRSNCNMMGRKGRDVRWMDWIVGQLLGLWAQKGRRLL